MRLLLTRLSELELFLPSFHAQYGYRNKLCAADVVQACEALLESMVHNFLLYFYSHHGGNGIVVVCLSVCTKYLEKLLTDFDEIFWSGDRVATLLENLEKSGN